MLKQVLFNHMMSREVEEEKEETEENKLSASMLENPEGPPAACDESRASAGPQKDDAQLPSAQTELPDTAERNGELSFLLRASASPLRESF